MTAGNIFLDTNILLRATIQQFPLYAEVKKMVQAAIDNQVQLWINRQVIREYFNQVTRPQSFMNPLPVEQVVIQYRNIKALCKVCDENEETTASLIALITRYSIGGKQIHDANIVATMLQNNITTLYTLNVDDMKRFDDQISIVTLAK